MSHLLRLAEMYLTQAEALARAGKDSEAQAVFTKFQITRDPSYVSKEISVRLWQRKL